MKNKEQNEIPEFYLFETEERLETVQFTTPETGPNCVICSCNCDCSGSDSDPLKLEL